PRGCHLGLTHTYTHSHTNTHARKHTHTRTHLQPSTGNIIQSKTQQSSSLAPHHRCTHFHLHRHVPAHTHTHTHTHHTNTLTLGFNVRAHTHTHTHGPHTYTHTHTRTHMHTCKAQYMHRVHAKSSPLHMWCQKNFTRPTYGHRGAGRLFKLPSLVACSGFHFSHVLIRLGHSAPLQCLP